MRIEVRSGLKLLPALEKLRRSSGRWIHFWAIDMRVDLARLTVLQSGKRNQWDSAVEYIPTLHVFEIEIIARAVPLLEPKSVLTYMCSVPRAHR